MRFLAGGPDIPDELLTARDEGRVVFFCGAGVSQAKVGLPGFFALARNVLVRLEGSGESDSKRLVNAAEKVEKDLSISGLVSADRVFGILEREFEIRDVEREVAAALRPPPSPDLSAHKLMLDLARGPDGRTRLITTNFDLLFEAADVSLKSWLPGRLPDPAQSGDLDGIVHLHGRVSHDYAGANGEGFVLSTAEFGRAYISRGWAARFISSVLSKYLVVFVGYTADDPPVQYLLEAVNRERGASNGLYAFQAVSHSDAAARWSSKGVQPISYDGENHHAALWATLTEWASRARDVEGWFTRVVETARQGPALLAPHQRGQVMHVVSTVDGARRFSRTDHPPPAEWLCVFDRTMRFAPPRNVHFGPEAGTLVDPFDEFGLDSDPAPSKGVPGQIIHKREVPDGAWDCFDLTRLDREGLPSQYFAMLAGGGSTSPPPLVPRLVEVAIWISAVAGQPAAAWWAAGKSGLHPDLQSMIHFRLTREKDFASEEVRKAWVYLIESWNVTPILAHREGYELEKSVELDGWSPAAVRRLAAINRPYFTSKRSSTHSHRPPSATESHSYSSLVSVDVEYPVLQRLVVPDDYLRLAVREWRRILERAVVLENEVSVFGLDRFESLVPAGEPGEMHGVSGIYIPIRYYVALMKRLLAFDKSAALEECRSWWTDDDHVFARLRIWASNEKGLLDGHDAATGLLALSRKAFWKHGHQRDLLFTLSRRWADVPNEQRSRLVERIVEGRQRWDIEEEAEYVERRTHDSLNVLHWLHDKGCDLGIDIEATTARLSALAPEWRREFAAETAEPVTPRVRRITNDSTFDELLAVPLDQVLSRAKDLSGRDRSRSVEKTPYAGLVQARPVRSLRALTRAETSGNHESWAWRTLLNEVVRLVDASKDAQDRAKKPGVRFTKVLAARLARLQHSALAELSNSVSEWILSVRSSDLVEIQELDALWMQLLAALKIEPARERGTGGKDPDWASEALNAPAGKLAQALLASSGNAEADQLPGFDPKWRERVEELLALGGDPRRHALAIFAYNLPWFFEKDPAWTSDHLLVALETPEDEGALWAGILWAGTVPQTPLYLRLKPALLRLERQQWIERDSHVQVLAGILLAGWATVEGATREKLVTDAEMRTLLLSAGDEFRAQVLWQIKRWTSEDPTSRWRTLVRTFLENAWPRQKVVKSPKASARLCELALSDPDLFGSIYDIVVNLVTTADRHRFHLIDFLDEPGKVVEKYPAEVLQLLFIVLPVDVSHWPYGIEKVFAAVVSAKAELQADGRLLELQRRWNAR